MYELLTDKLLELKNTNIFYGVVSKIEKLNERFLVNIDLVNDITNDIDEILFAGKIKGISYSFELIIETYNLAFLGHKGEVFKLEVLKADNRFNIYEGRLILNTKKKFDKINPYKNKKVKVKIEKASLEYKKKYKDNLNKHLKYLANFYQINERLELPGHKQYNNRNVEVKYSQYYVGNGNCSYINIGNISKGFFNLGFSKIYNQKVYRYSGFSNHKPDWIIISDFNRSNYCAANRYGTSDIFKCNWIFPLIEAVNINLIRLFYSIINNGGKINLLKYKANSSVCTLAIGDVCMDIYFTSEVNDDNGLCLYIEKDSKFISFGNSDYNFMTKSLVNQQFDVIVYPAYESKYKTKVAKKKHTNYNIGRRDGFKIHRIDKLGSFICKL